MNTVSATASLSPSGNFFLNDTDDFEVSYIAYQISVVEPGSVTAGNLGGTIVPLSNAEAVIGDIDARTGRDFSDVGGVDLTTGSTPDSITVGSELVSFNFPAGTLAANFDTYVLDNFGTSEPDTTNPDFAVIANYDNFTSGTYLHGVFGEDGNGNRGAVFGFSADIVRDTDGDGIGDHKDLDSDNDGISDLEESGQDPSVVDANGDGVVDGAVDQATGVPLASNGGAGVDPIDSDNDGVDDYLDLDSDDDGIPDVVEGQPTGAYVPPTGVDSDGDGVDDAYDITAGHGADFTPTEDTDADGTPDVLDSDSDNDGIDDIVESGQTLSGNDANNDGIDDAVNASYADPDGDVDVPISDLENGTDNDTTDADYRSVNLSDKDWDGIPDDQDADADGDGILDADETTVAIDSQFDGAIDAANLSFGITSASPNTPGTAHILDSITISGVNSIIDGVYTDLIVPDGYSSSFNTNQVSDVDILENGSVTADINDPNFDAAALDAFQDFNLQHFQRLDQHDFRTNNSYTLTYNTPVLSSAGGFVALTERNGNNPQQIEAFDAAGNSLGMINLALADYVDTGHAANVNQNINLALYAIDDLAPVGTEISSVRVTFTGNQNSTDGPDGKVFFYGNAEAVSVGVLSLIHI